MYAESSLLKLIKFHKKQRPKKLVGGSMVSIQNLIRGREMFFMAVFLTLIFQTSLTFGVMLYGKYFPELQRQISQYILLVFVVQLAIVIVLAFVPMHPLVKFFLFTLFAVIVGMVLSILSSTVSQQVIKTALVGTISIFVLMILFGVILTLLGFDLNWMFGILFFALLSLIILRIVTLFMKASASFTRYLAIFALLIFALFIVYDTNDIMQRDYGGDFVTASLDYFLDIINLFVNMIQVVGGDR